MFRLRYAILATSLLAAAGAHAGSTATQFQVTAQVLDSCTVAADDLNFGNYDPRSATALDGTSQLRVACTLLTAYNVALNPGTSVGATVTTRKMSKATDTLGYTLFRDALRTLNWGQTAGTDTVSGTGTGLTANLSVYGRVPGSQNVPTGSYLDTITVTVSY